MTSDPAGLAAVDLSNPQSLNRYAYVMNDPLNWIDPFGLRKECAKVAYPPGGYPPNYINEGWVWTQYCIDRPSEEGPDETFDCAVEDGRLICPKMPHHPNNPAANNGKPCGSTGFGLGVSYGGSADLGNGALGVTSTASGGAGLFYDSNTGTSAGAFAGGGASANAAFLYKGVPAQQGQSISIGAFAGGGPSVFVTNGHSVRQLGGPFTTWTLNIGAGPIRFSAQLSYGGGIWQASVGPPVPFVSGGTPSASFTKVTTKTTTTNAGCGG